jgi:CheY-like chemotaxis protein
VVYGIVKQSGGDVQVWSMPGQGTRFDLYFPRAASPAAGPAADASAEAEAAAAERGSETILLVEDEASVRDLAGLELQDLGYTVLAAADPGEALGHARGTAAIQLLLTDLALPGMTGSALAQVVRAQRPELKVLFMSGYAQRHVLDREALSPGMAFLEKPFSVETLARKVREVLDAPAPGA